MYDYVLNKFSEMGNSEDDLLRHYGVKYHKERYDFFANSSDEFFSRTFMDIWKNSLNNHLETAIHNQTYYHNRHLGEKESMKLSAKAVQDFNLHYRDLDYNNFVEVLNKKGKRK